MRSSETLTPVSVPVNSRFPAAQTSSPVVSASVTDGLATVSVSAPTG
ncbi:hypothetical protein NKG05_24080 [Oerskovia sp. M15]